MRVQNKVYAVSYLSSLAAGPGANLQSVFRISSNNREIKLKSVTIDALCVISATSKKIDLSASQDHYFYFQINFGGVQITGSPVELVAGAAWNNINGSFTMFAPGQLIFDSFYIKNYIDFFLDLRNESAAVPSWNFNIIIETEEKNIYL
jgi:hypothetical protein